MSTTTDIDLIHAHIRANWWNAVRDDHYNTDDIRGVAITRVTALDQLPGPDNAAEAKEAGCNIGDWIIEDQPAAEVVRIVDGAVVSLYSLP